MKIIDLSYLIHPDMPVYPGTELPVFQQGNLLEKDGFRENLTNLDAVKENIFMLSVLPLQYKNADGSPVRAMAIEKLL